MMEQQLIIDDNSTSPPCYVDSLPVEILNFLFDFIDKGNDKSSVMSVCKKWNNLGNIVYDTRGAFVKSISNINNKMVEKLVRHSNIRCADYIVYAIKAYNYLALKIIIDNSNDLRAEDFGLFNTNSKTYIEDWIYQNQNKFTYAPRFVYSNKKSRALFDMNKVLELAVITGDVSLIIALFEVSILGPEKGEPVTDFVIPEILVDRLLLVMESAYLFDITNVSNAIYKAVTMIPPKTGLAGSWIRLLRTCLLWGELSIISLISKKETPVSFEVLVKDIAFESVKTALERRVYLEELIPFEKIWTDEVLEFACTFAIQNDDIHFLSLLTRQYPKIDKKGFIKKYHPKLLLYPGEFSHTIKRFDDTYKRKTKGKKINEPFTKRQKRG
jgi:hypothetical protein